MTAGLAWRLLLVTYVSIGCGVGRDLLLGKVVRCSRDLLLVPAGAVRVAASAVLLGSPRTIAIVHIAILDRTGLDPIAVILNEVMDVVVQVLVSLPGAAAHSGGCSIAGTTSGTRGVLMLLVRPEGLSSARHRLAYG